MEQPKATTTNTLLTTTEQGNHSSSSPSNTVLPDITGAIGRTPLVELSRLTKQYGVQGRILAKLEYLNPGFSKKDRIARQILLEAMASGALKPGQTVVELTSGNTGTGLAICCAVWGYPFVAVMSAGNSMERARMMRAFGAEVVIVDQAPGSTPGQVSGEDLRRVEERTKELAQERQAFRADQFQRTANARSHLEGTAPEIWEASGGSVTAFCDFVGTGGSFGGCASFFHQYSVKCYIVEPAGAAVLAGHEVTRPNHRVQGGGYLMNDLPMIASQTLIDGYIQVNDSQAIQVARDLAKYEGIFGGFSAGANAAAAIELLRTKHQGGTIAILICDSGLKYLSTDLWG